VRTRLRFYARIEITSWMIQEGTQEDWIVRSGAADLHPIADRVEER